MKQKFMILVAILLCSVSAVSAQDTSKANKTEQALMDGEKMAWKELVDKKYDDFGKRLADDYRSVYSFGSFDKTVEMEMIRKQTLTSAEVSDQKIQWIDKNSGILISMVRVEAVTTAGKNVTANLKTTTVFTKRGKDWLVVYHTDIR